jgi:spoIIIJ-associated protein
MEWVETTAKTLEAAKDMALDRLGVAADEAEFDVLEEPRPGLFGRMRGEARVRARVMPAAVRPKQDRRGRGRRGRQERQDSTETKQRDASSTSPPTDREPATTVESTGAETESVPPSREPSDQSAGGGARRRNRPKSKQQKEQQVSTEEQDSESSVTPQEVADAAATFMTGLATAFGAEAETEIAVDGTDIDVRVTGSDLGLMVGHGGRTLIAVQDLARVASQRRLGDHDTRLRIDVAGYREKRRIALERFAVAVANEVVSSGQAKALEPMQSADRKIVHDALASVDGVTSRSEGDDPMRRVVITPS